MIDRVWKKEYTMLIHKTLWIKAFCVGQDAFSRSRERRCRLPEKRLCSLHGIHKYSKGLVKNMVKAMAAVRSPKAWGRWCTDTGMLPIFPGRLKIFRGSS